MQVGKTREKGIYLNSYVEAIILDGHRLSNMAAGVSDPLIHAP